MIQQLLKYGNTFCAVEHSIDENSSETFYTLQLKKSKKELLVTSKELHHSFDETLTCLKAQRHVFLVINNQQVLLKKIEDTNSNSQQLVKTAFPNIKLSDFYYEITRNNENSFIAICRKEYVNKIIQQYRFNGIAVIDFSLDSLAIHSLFPYLNQKEIYTTTSQISLSQDSINSINKNIFTEKEYSINNMLVSNRYVLSLAGIISYLSGVSRFQTGFENLQNELQQYYNSKRFYTLGLKTTLGSVFLILLINFVFFSKAHSEVSILKAELLVNSSYKNTLIKLQERVDKKNELATSITSISATKTSWYINEIGKSVPNKLQLIELKFQPLIKSIKKNKEIKVDKNNILVKGISKSNKDFSKWYSSLELKEWIEKIVVISYGKGKRTTASFEFIITIK